MGTVIFNGVSSEDLGIVVQSPPSHNFPEKDLEYVKIPGKNGDFLLGDGAYKNVERKYYFAAEIKNNENFSNKMSAIASWLKSSKEYSILEDSYEPDVYRKAIYKDEGSLPNYLWQATSLEATFSCKPQCYLKSGNEEFKINVTESSTDYEIVLENPTLYDSLPLILFSLDDSSDENAKVNIQIQNGTYSSVITYRRKLSDNLNLNGIIDSELEECYDGSEMINKAVAIINYEFPVLKKGTTNITVSIDDGIGTVSFIPRWWRL